MIDSRYLGWATSLLLLTGLSAVGQNAPANAVPLKNWATPLYWQSNQAERENAAKSAAQIQFSPNATTNAALIFVAVSPCRLVDTRGVSAGFAGVTPFNGPYIPAGGTATFPVQSTTETQTTAPSPCGTIPSIAQAYSLNLTVVPHPFGTPVNYVTMWPTGVTIPIVSTLNDSQGAVTANAAIVPAGTPSGGINVYAYGPADVIIDMNGFYAAPTDLNSNTAVGLNAMLSPTTGINGAMNNSAFGEGALQSITSGGANVATGYLALQNDTYGNGNTATGSQALQLNTTGAYNQASGLEALSHNIGGDDNTADGTEALYSNTSGNQNTAVGQVALYSNTVGNYNTVIGSLALQNNTTGSNNIAIGYNAAGNVSGSANASNNIHIGNLGASTDTNVIWIGTQGTQTVTKIAGIYGQSISTPNYQVCIDATARLGAGGSCSGTPSSRRFKNQITDMGDRSSKLLELRPVTFFYKPEYDDGSHLRQYGLIAEEVAKIYPDMVGYDEDGQPNSVKYQSLAPMLLNEVQKLAAQNQSQGEENRKVEEQDRRQTEQIHSLEQRLAALEALLTGTAAAKSGGSQ